MGTLLKIFGRDPDDPRESYLALDARQVRVVRGGTSRAFFRSRSDYVEAVLPDAPIQIVFRVEIRGFFPREFLLAYTPGQPVELRPIGEPNDAPIPPSSVLSTGPLGAIESFELWFYSVRNQTGHWPRLRRPTRAFPFPFDFELRAMDTIALQDHFFEERAGVLRPAVSIIEKLPAGRLIFLDRPPPARPLVLAAWIPETLPHPGDNERIDYHMFFHPAAPDDRYYPNGHQTVALAQRYLLAYSEAPSDRMQLIHQHALSGKKFVLVFPIGSPSSLRDLESANGFWDSIHRIHWEVCRITGSPHSRSHVGRIGLSGWSFGVSRIGRILTSLRNNPTHELNRHLCELALLDGPNARNEELIDPLIEIARLEAKHWFNSSRSNVLRVYTQDRRWNRLTVDEHASGSRHGVPLLAHPVEHSPSRGHGYTGIHDGRFTLLVANNELWLNASISDHYVQHSALRGPQWPGNASRAPEMRDAQMRYNWVHGTICRYCLSHTFRHSKLGGP